MKKSTLFSFFTFSFLIVISASHANIYKWKDETGQIHYTQTPPTKGLKSKKISSRTPTPKIPDYLKHNNKLQPNLANLPFPTNNRRLLNIVPNTADAIPPQPSPLSKQSDTLNEPDALNQSETPNEKNKPIENYCKGQKANLKTLQDNTEINWKEGDSTTRLNSEQRLQKIQTIKDDIEFHC